MRLMPEPMFSTTSMRYSRPNSSGFRGTLLVPQIRFRHARGQPARTDDLDPVLEDVDLDVGRRAVVAVRHRVRDGLPQRLLRQLRPFLPPHVPDDEELDVDLRQDPRHRVVDHRRHIPVEVPSIEDSHLLRAEEQRARHVGRRREAAHVAGEKPRPGLRHPVVVVDEAEIPERHQAVHGLRDLGTAAEPRPGLVIEIALDGEVRARHLVEVQASGRVEQVFHLRVRHRPAARSVAHEEPSPERVRLAILRRHDDAQHGAETLDLHPDGQIRRAAVLSTRAFNRLWFATPTASPASETPIRTVPPPAFANAHNVRPTSLVSDRLNSILQRRDPSPAAVWVSSPIWELNAFRPPPASCRVKPHSGPAHSL